MRSGREREKARPIPSKLFGQRRHHPTRGKRCGHQSDRMRTPFKHLRPLRKLKEQQRNELRDLDDQVCRVHHELGALQPRLLSRSVEALWARLRWSVQLTRRVGPRRSGGQNVWQELVEIGPIPCDRRADVRVRNDGPDATEGEVRCSCCASSICAWCTSSPQRGEQRAEMLMEALCRKSRQCFSHTVVVEEHP